MNALIIINERAGSVSPETLERSIREELARYPARVRDNVDIMVTASVDAVTEAIAQRQGELDRVIAAGGDGTVITVISAMLLFPHLQLGIIPVGTGNRLACNLDIPTHIKGALETALQGVPYRIDVGRINGRYFAFMAGAGLDAEIMDRVLPIEKRTMGIFAYFWKGLQRALLVPYTVFDIEADGQRVRARGVGVVVANGGNLLGRLFTLTPGAKPDDGLLDLCLLASRRRTDYLTTLIQILSQEYRGIHQEGVKHLRARRITIRSRPRVKVEADGDVIGTTPVEIEALPGAIAVLVPNLRQHPIAQGIHNLRDHLWLLLRDFLGR